MHGHWHHIWHIYLQIEYYGWPLGVTLLYGQLMGAWTRRYPDQDHGWHTAIVALLQSGCWVLSLLLNHFIGKYRRFQFRPLTREWKDVAYSTQFPLLPITRRRGQS